MKIAIVTDDGKTISPHFGRASKYAVITIQEGKITNRELRDKVGHQEFSAQDKEHKHEHHHRQDEKGHGFGKHAAEKHNRMFANITDCDLVLARGMGRGAYQGLEQSGLKPVITDIKDIDKAVQAVIDDNLVDHPERLH
jgi:predicted Fe-Mo cluster-binding NifX family protein